jgi:hypothetical protein
LKFVEAGNVSFDLKFFDDPNEAPRPPEEVRITEVRADPLPDGRRVVVHIKLTPFLKKPNLDVTLLRDEIEERSLSIIESIEHEMQVTLHLPSDDPAGSYTLRVDLLREEGVQQSESVQFDVENTAR